MPPKLPVIVTLQFLAIGTDLIEEETGGNNIRCDKIEYSSTDQ